jgi:hypothetical protein
MYFVAKPNEEAKAFIQAAGLTDQTQMKAVGTLVFDLKNYNLWDKMKAIYPFVGGTATSHKFNLKDPRDADSAFRLFFSGSWTHSSTGATPSTAYAETYLNSSTELSLNSGSFGVYLNSFVNEKIPMLIYDSINFVGTWVIERMVNSNVDVGFHDGLTSNAPGPLQSAGFYQISRNNNTQLFFRTNNILQTRSVNSTGLVNRTFKLGAFDNNGSFSQFMINQARFFYIGTGLTITEQSNLYTAVQRFQTTLGRQV